MDETPNPPQPESLEQQAQKIINAAQGSKAPRTRTPTVLEKDVSPARVLPPMKSGMLAAERRLTWLFYAPDDFLPEDLERDEVWAAAGERFNQYDRVEVIQRSRWTELLVHDIGPGFRCLKIMSTMDLPPRRDATQIVVPKDYEIQPGGPGEEPFIIIRKSDGYVINKGQNHRTKLEALTYLANHAALRT